jgi:hypothetical protein
VGGGELGKPELIGITASVAKREGNALIVEKF